jgi:hypothetical protein
MLALFSTTALAAPPPCVSLSWSVQVAPDEVREWPLVADGTPVATVRSRDGGTESRAGWLPDEDPRRGWVRARLPLACGLRSEGAARSESAAARGTLAEAGSALDSTAENSVLQTILVQTPPEATGVFGWGKDEHGDWTGATWAPAPQGEAHLAVEGARRWELSALGTARPWRGELRDGADTVRLEPHSPMPRTWSPRFRSRFLWALLPVQLLCIGVGLVVWARSARRLGGVASALAVGLGLGLLWPVLADPGARLLWTGGAVVDPRDSAALLAQLADALLRGGDVGFRFRYPEGSSVLWGGPSLLGYLPGLPWAWAGSPVAGHNLAGVFWLAVMALSCGGLARSRGLGPAGVLVAVGAAVASPALVDELDGWSLDRATLAVVPLVAWALEHCARRPGPRGAALVGIAVAAGIYAQVYTGLYLAVLVPMWCLLHLWGHGARRRLKWLLAGGVLALGLAAPALHHLHTGTSPAAGTDDPRPLADTEDSVLEPFPDNLTAEAAIQRSRQARRTRAGLAMATATERLATAQALALDGRELVAPARWVALGRWWWLLAGLLVVLARDRRRAVSTVAEPASLLVFAAGPFLLWDGRWTGVPLPHLLPWLALPGWEQLKNVHRAALMAAPLAGLVPAGVVDRLAPRRGAAVVGLLAAGLVILISHQGLPKAPKTRLLPREPALEPARGSAVVALPLDSPAPPEVVELALVHGLSIVGEPPFETRRAGAQPWLEDNALLSAWALGSGSTRPRRSLYSSDPGASLAELRHYGVAGVVLVHAALPEGQGAALPAALDADLEPGGRGRSASLWWLPPGPEAP